MLYGFKSKKIVQTLMLVVGIVSLVYGVVAYQFAPEDAHDYSMLLGMFSGFGTGLIAVAVFFHIRSKVVSPEKLKQKEIEQHDERNIAISRAAFTVTALAGLILFVVLAFVFVATGQRLASYLCIGAIYLQLITFLISVRIFQKKM